MSKFLEAVAGYCALPIILGHAITGFLLMIAAVFLGIPDLIGSELHPLVGFPLLMLAVGLWIWAGLCTLNWIITGMIWFPAPAAESFRLTILGLFSRLVVSAGVWLMVLALLSLVPAERSLMLQPLSFGGARAVPLLTRFVDDPSPRVRRSAIDALRQIGPPARSSAPTIAKHLNDPDEQVRLEAKSAMHLLGPELLGP